MQIIREGPELARALAELRGGGATPERRVALVPTMGALHAGHMALIAEARRRADRVVASLFVNPAQFGPGEDFDQYPRQEQRDLEMLEAAGVALTWAPQVRDIYPDGFATSVRVSGVSDRWEGEVRPGHFDGVATVVAKLLLGVQPQVALFGEKDFQQLAVVRRMVADLGLPVEVVGVPTVREEDGLALSSRNAYLSPEGRARAAALPQALQAARSDMLGGLAVEDGLQRARNMLREAGFDPIDYLALVDAETLEPRDGLHGSMRVIAAARLGSTRLIDNLAI